MESPEVWQRCKKGDRDAFRQLYMAHIDNLMAYGHKLCQDTEILEDAVHDLFVYIWEKRETLGETDSIIKYLCVSLRRSLYKNLEENAKTLHADYLENHHFLTTPSIETEWAAKEEADKNQKRLQQAMTRLPKRQQEAIHLKYYQNMSYEDICSIMDINYQSVRNLISKAVIDLRNLM
jgi:RNA polymerase sigma factor (sigma-70 family)